MPAYLDTIVAHHRARVAGDHRDLSELLETARRAGPSRPFAGALCEARSRSGIGVIAEIKRRSPSKGDLDGAIDPALVAADYERGGAACLSVLTDSEFFSGSPDDLRHARVASSLPVLRKDFTLGARDVCDARVMGADAVLLIVAALSDPELRTFLDTAQACMIEALVEVHDESELVRAMDSGARMIGVNQRDLATFEVDGRRAEALARRIPGDVVKVAESGIQSPLDVGRLAEAGFDAVLVGERLIRSEDRAGAVAALLGSRR
ncbi:MAG: indole-3-glycerol phosphate synthase TrpC [Acidimicrobiales bacterium]